MMATRVTLLPPKPVPLADNWCLTQANITKTSFEWSIDWNNFRSSKVGAIHESPLFSAGNGNDENAEEFQWKLELYPNGQTEESKDHIGLFLYYQSEGGITAKGSFSLLNAIRVRQFTRQLTLNKFDEGRGWGFTQFLSHKYLLARASDLLVDGRLIICCEIRSIVSDNHVTCVHRTKKLKTQLSKHFGPLAEDDQYGDVTLLVDEKEIRACKGILAARSSVFAEMFRQKQDHFVIEDIEQDVFKEMLYFIYTNTAPKMPGMTFELLIVAEKFALPELKAMCEEELVVALAANNAAKILVVADLHHAELLKAKAIKYIEKNGAKVWENVKRQYPYLVTAAYIAMQ